MKRTGLLRHLTEEFDPESIAHLQALFRDPDKAKVARFVVENDLLPDDVLNAVEQRRRQLAVAQFESMLLDDRREQEWQRWFKGNDWVLGSDFVRVLDEREIDTDHIADYLVEAYDGFLDLVELKRPEGHLRFWADQRDHGNYVPAADLIKAVSQATNYLYQVELEANSQKFLERVGVKAIKPRATLIFGRSNGWDDEQRAAYRLLNRSYRLNNPDL